MIARSPRVHGRDIALGHPSPVKSVNYDPDDNGTRILTDGRAQIGNYAENSEVIMKNAHMGSDDPNRIPTFVKVRGLPANQDPRIVPKKKQKKKKMLTHLCGVKLPF